MSISTGLYPNLYLQNANKLHCITLHHPKQNTKKMRLNHDLKNQLHPDRLKQQRQYT